MLKYYKLFDLLNRREMKKTDLLEVISPPTLAKLGKGKNVQTDAIDRICLHLGCQPGDIMECIEDEYTNEHSKIMVKNELKDEFESHLIADEIETHPVDEMIDEGISFNELDELCEEQAQNN